MRLKREACAIADVFAGFQSQVNLLTTRTNAFQSVLAAGAGAEQKVIPNTRLSLENTKNFTTSPTNHEQSRITLFKK